MFDETTTAIDTDTYKPIPPRHEWKDMSAPQLIDVKNRLIGYTFSLPRDAVTQHRSLQEGISALDSLIANYGK